MLEPRPDWSPFGLNLKFLTIIPSFLYGSPPSPPPPEPKTQNLIAFTQTRSYHRLGWKKETINQLSQIYSVFLLFLFYYYYFFFFFFSF